MRRPGAVVLQESIRFWRGWHSRLFCRRHQQWNICLSREMACHYPIDRRPASPLERQLEHLAVTNGECGDHAMAQLDALQAPLVLDLSQGATRGCRRLCLQKQRLQTKKLRRCGPEATATASVAGKNRDTAHFESWPTRITWPHRWPILFAGRFDLHSGSHYFPLVPLSCIMTYDELLYYESKLAVKEQ